MLSDVSIVPLQEEFVEVISQTSGGAAWHQDRPKWSRYFIEHSEGKRHSLIAFVKGQPVGYGSLVFQSQYPPFRKSGTPEINDLVPEKAAAARAETLTATAPDQLGKTIGALRSVAGLTQAALADKLKTSRANVIRLEKGRSIPSTTTLQKIAAATGHRLIISFRKGKTSAA